MAAIAIYPRLVWCAATVGCGALVSRLWPAHASGAFVAAMLAAFVMAAWLLPRGQRSTDEKRRPPGG